jgi:hypothetical protein
MGTNKFNFYSYLSLCCRKLGKNEHVYADLHELGELIPIIKDQKLGITLYTIASLTFSYLAIKIYDITIHDDTLRNIKLEIISRITTDEAANYVKKSLEVQNALEHRDWLYWLPPLFARKFDDCIFLLNDITEGYHHVVYKEFYKLIENFLKVIVEFNAQILWNDNYEMELKSKLDTSKDFNSFTFGEFSQSLEILLKYEIEFLSQLSPSLLDVLKFHVENRNKITHEYEIENSIDILKDTTELFLGLLKSFPTVIKITDIKRKPWYDVEILWNLFPRKVSLYSDKELYEGQIYYLQPMFEILDNRISPQLIIPSYCV